MRTIIYIDGLNLYHGLLERSSYYWVDIKKLCKNILPVEYSIVKIKYFTAPLSNDKGKVKVEDAHNALFYALKAHYSPDEFELFLGFFTNRKTTAQKVNSNQFVKIYKREEKRTDVNIAAHILNDAWLDKYDCAVLISNDSDMCEAIRLIKDNSQTSGKQIFLMTPTKLLDNGETIRACSELKKTSNKAFKIEEKDLEQNQLTGTITTNFDGQFRNQIDKIKMPSRLRAKLLSWLDLPTIDKPFQDWHGQ